MANFAWSNERLDTKRDNIRLANVLHLNNDNDAFGQWEIQHGTVQPIDPSTRLAASGG